MHGFLFLITFFKFPILEVRLIVEQFVSGLQATTAIEYIAVLAGIASVWYSRKENILVYPVGLINTVIYVFLSFQYHLLGEASVNFYYTVMSVYGWYLWTKKDARHHKVLRIQFSTAREWLWHLFFFVGFYVVIFFSLQYLKKSFASGAIPWADALASAAAFTGMWLMAKKKVESWLWWLLTNICSIPLYFVKGLVFTSVYYLVLLVLAVYGLLEWRQRALIKDKTDG